MKKPNYNYFATLPDQMVEDQNIIKNNPKKQVKSQKQGFKVYKRPSLKTLITCYSLCACLTFLPALSSQDVVVYNRTECDEYIARYFGEPEEVKKF